MTNHSEAEVLAAFVEGRLEGDELAGVAEHLQQCEQCRTMVGEAMAFEREEQTAAKPRRSWLPLAAAAAVAVIVIAAFVPGYRHRQSMAGEVAELLATKPQRWRPVEGRLGGQQLHTGYFRMRGGNEESLDLQLESAAAKLAETAEGDISPAGRRAAALAAAMQKRPQEALAALLQIPADQRDAVIWNDMAAMYLQLDDRPHALEAVRHALQRQPKMPEALFNRAMILHYDEKQKAAAIDAWNQYLVVDPSSPWAEEARGNLARLNEHP